MCTYSGYSEVLSALNLPRSVLFPGMTAAIKEPPEDLFHLRCKYSLPFLVQSGSLHMHFLDGGWTLLTLGFKCISTLGWNFQWLRENILNKKRHFLVAVMSCFRHKTNIDYTSILAKIKELTLMVITREYAQICIWDTCISSPFCLPTEKLLLH